MIANGQDCVKNNILEITDLLRYWPMLETCGGKALDMYLVHKPVGVFHVILLFITN